MSELPKQLNMVNHLGWSLRAITLLLLFSTEKAFYEASVRAFKEWML